MDVGFNNKNKLHEALDCKDLEDIVWLVEATSEERHELWSKYHKKYKWEQVGYGYDFQITTLDVINKNGVKEKLPVCLSFYFVIINGYKIAFIESNCTLVHHGYIDAFLSTYFQRTHDNYSRWNHTNATNFHNCINYLDTLDKEPRDSIYTPSEYNKMYHIFEPSNEHGKYIENLTTLKKDKLIKDHKGRIFIVNKLENNGQFVNVELSELTDGLCNWTCKLPMACNDKKEFISPNDSDFKFRFEVLNYTKEELCKLALKNVK